jgi:hypothetical protein
MIQCWKRLDKLGRQAHRGYYLPTILGNTLAPCTLSIHSLMFSPPSPLRLTGGGKVTVSLALLPVVEEAVLARAAQQQPFEHAHVRLRHRA